MKLRVCRRPVIILSLLVIAVLTVCTQFRSAHVLPATPDSAGALPIPGSTISADFDGDLKPDTVIGAPVAHGYVLQVQFSTRVSPAQIKLAVDVPGARIFSRDFNHDNDADLIITSCTSLLPVAVYLGDGKGHFQPGNPWNCLPVGLDPTTRYAPCAEHESAAADTEGKRTLPGIPAANLPPPAPDDGRNNNHDAGLRVPRAAASIFAARAPPALFLSSPGSHTVA